MANSNKMKTLTIDDVTYEVCDEVARTSIGDLSELSTVNKSTLVAAINEAARTGGNGDSSGGMVANYNPITKTDDMTQPVGVDEEGRLWVAPIGGGSSGDTPDVPVVPGSHGIVWDLVNVTSSSNLVSVSDGAALIAVLTAAEGYSLGDVTITMGGEVLTGAWNADTATVTIASVTGDVVISCAGVAEPIVRTEVLKAGYGAANLISGHTSVATEDGDNTAAITISSKLYDAATNSNGDSQIAYFNTEIAGGTVVVEYDPDVASKLYWVIYFTKTPVQYSSVSPFTLAKCLVPSGWTGESGSNGGLYGDISATGFLSGDDLNNALSKRNALTLSNGTAKIKVPDGYYIYMASRKSGSVVTVDGVDLSGNAPYTKWVYDNVSVTVTTEVAASEGESTSSAEMVDADYAMDYGIAVTDLVTEEAEKTKVDIDKGYAAVIEEAKNAWMTEANGNIDKIPLLIHTDQHGNFNKPLFDFIGEIVDWYDVGKVINLGDTVNSYGGDLLSDGGLKAYIESMESVPYSKRIEVFGNHDTWGNSEDGTGRFTPQNYLHKYFRNIYARRFDNHGNFVTYDDNYNVKYVVVSGFAYDSAKGGYSHYIIPSVTIDRIIDELEKVDGYDVILLSHVPLTAVNFKSLNDLWSGRKAKTSGSVTDEYGISHAFDFTNCDGELLCGLHGHKHEDGHEYIGELLDVWFDAYYIQPRVIHFVIVDRENRRLNVWNVDNTPQYQNYQIPFDKPTE